MANENKALVGDRAGQYYLLGVDWRKKTFYIPNWGWGLAGLFAVWRLFLKKLLTGRR